jgi:hypothetical protein
MNIKHNVNISFLIKNFIRGNAATNYTPNEGGKFHREKIKEVEMFQYDDAYYSSKIC